MHPLIPLHAPPYRDRAQVKVLMSTALCGALLGGVAMSAMCILCVAPVMRALGVDASVISAVSTYVLFRAIGNPLFVMANVSEGAFIGLRDTVTPLIVRAAPADAANPPRGLSNPLSHTFIL
jgi:Na+-driven multidrug efflux pump